MGLPKSGELDALLGRGGGLSEAPLRQSKLVSRRHPDEVWLQASPNVRQRWVNVSTGRTDVDVAGPSEGVFIDFRWRVHPRDGVVVMVVSPLTAVHGLVSALPDRCTWGFIQSPTLELEHTHDAMAHAEFLFANGRSLSSGVCPGCRGRALSPL